MSDKIKVTTTPKNRITITTGGSGSMAGAALASDLPPIWYHANGAANVANWAYNSANSNWTVQNAIFTVANSAFLRANVLVRVGNVVPSSPAAVLGNLWWNTDLGKLFIYYVDGDSSQWVETSPSINTSFISAGSTTIYTGGSDPSYAYAAANMAYATANAAYAAANSGGGGGGTANLAPVFIVANASFIHANAAFDKANAALTHANLAYFTANDAYSSAQLAACTAFDALYTASGAFDKANAANLLAYNTGIGANAYAVSVGAAVNSYAITMDTAGNNYTISVGAASNNWANTLLTTGTSNGVFNNVTASTVYVDRFLSLGATEESMDIYAGVTGAYSLNCATSYIFYLTPTGNFTANLTNFVLHNNNVTSITMVLNQGATPYMSNNYVYTGSANLAINWQAGTAPTGTANKKDVITLSIFNVNGANTVLGQLVSFG